MKFSDYDQNELFQVIKPVCDGFDVSIVHLSSARVKNTLQVRLVLHKKNGITIDVCSEISKAVLPRIEIWADERDVNLEVSSPGLGRILKDAYEFSIFTDENVRLLVNQEWIDGKIICADNTSVEIEAGDEKKTFKFEAVQKAKLY